MNKSVCNLAAVLLTGFLSLTAVFSLTADNLDSPHMFLNNLTKDVVAVLNNNQKIIEKDPSQSSKIVEPIIEPYISFDLMSSYIVGKKAWTEASADERKNFIREFKFLIMRTYSTTILAVIDGKIKYYPPKGGISGKERVQVPSVVSLDSKKVRLMYRLVKEENTWKIYDILVEKVSLVKGFRSQFAEIIQKGKGVAGVIKELKSFKGTKKDVLQIDKK